MFKRGLNDDGADVDDQQPAGPAKRLRLSPNSHVHHPSTSGTCQRKSRLDYTVGWICAVHTEYVAAQVFLDQVHERPDALPPEDCNDYTLGMMKNHNVVIACLPLGEYGIAAATGVAKDMLHSFPRIGFALMVGIGGGAPSERQDIRLGDVVVSQPREGMGGVFQYDFGKKRQDQAFHPTAFMNRPPNNLLAALSGLKARHTLQGHRLGEAVSFALQENTRLESEFGRPESKTDVLYRSDFIHRGASESTCESVCGNASSCIVQRKERQQCIAIHYGLIASANQVMKDASIRDQLSREKNVLCFEMEAAGLMNTFPCLVIRGICDYSDSHKNHGWQGYAAMVAAAYAKDLLGRITPTPSEGNAITTEQPAKTQDLGVEVSEQACKDLMSSLSFEEIDTRRNTIKNAHAKTCKWFLKNPVYLSWHELSKISEHFGFLWIKGKPGAGKSTLMKFALGRCRSRTKSMGYISFFFNARGSDLEKSTVGMYCSLLRQMLEIFPRLQSVFHSMKPSPQNGDHFPWTIESLQALFEQAVLSLTNSPLTCFIDALDECPEQEIRNMISFLENLGETAVSSGIEFRVCFSSRHYPHITISKGLTLVLEEEKGHDEDIADYIESELKIGHGDTAEQIRSELQEKASGVFMWVVLVVGILKKEFDRGRVKQLRKKLRETPADLHDLFRDILIRDGDNRDELLLCMQWVLFATKPLKPKELFFAIESDCASDPLSDCEDDEIEESDARRFILDCSKGLTEVTNSKVPTVQFIHESVRDFLLKDKGLEIVSYDLGNNIEGRSHDRLKRCCLNYLVNVGEKPYPGKDQPLPRASTDAAADLRHQNDIISPFLAYSVQNVLYHANAAGSNGISQASFVQSFPLGNWVRLNNLIEKYHVRRYNQPTFLYVAAEKSLGNLLRHCLDVKNCFFIESERYRSPVLAALEMGNIDAIKSILKAVQRAEPKSSSFHSLCERYYQEPCHQPLRLKRLLKYSKELGPRSKYTQLYLYNVHPAVTSTYLITTGSSIFDRKMLDQQGERFLLKAIDGRNEFAVQWLLDRCAELQYNSSNFLLPLWQNSKRHGVTKMLLELASVPPKKIQEGYTALHLASWKGDTATVALFLEWGFEMNAIRRYGATALMEAMEAGHTETARLLLDKGASLSWVSASGGISLASAVRKADAYLINLLLHHGANPNQWVDFNDSKCSYLSKSSSLVEALRTNQPKFVKLLLQRGARAGYMICLSESVIKGNTEFVEALLGAGNSLKDVHSVSHRKAECIELVHAIEKASSAISALLSKGFTQNVENEVRSALVQCAGHLGLEDCVRLLVDDGDSPFSTDLSMPELLMKAVKLGHDHTVELLLSKGASVDSRDVFDRTLLHQATVARNEGMVHLLLRMGASTEVRDCSGMTPLCYATEANALYIVERLVENGAVLDTRDLLMKAASRGHHAVVTLLLERGAILETVDFWGKTASMLATRGPIAVEELLPLWEPSK